MEYCDFKDTFNGGTMRAEYTESVMLQEHCYFLRDMNVIYCHFILSAY
jgi:hypothetical protein